MVSRHAVEVDPTGGERALAEVEQHLEALGAQSAASKAKLARDKLLEALKEGREDQEWARLAEERLARPEQTYSLEEVARDLGLDGAALPSVRY